jgi:hypothetical protein
MGAFSRLLADGNQDAPSVVEYRTTPVVVRLYLRPFAELRAAIVRIGWERNELTNAAGDEKGGAGR